MHDRKKLLIASHYLNDRTIDYYIYGLAIDDVTVLLIGDYSVTRVSFVFKFETLLF